MLGSLNESMMKRLTSSVSGYGGYIRVGEGGRQRGGDRHDNQSEGTGPTLDELLEKEHVEAGRKERCSRPTVSGPVGEVTGTAGDSGR